MALLLELLLKGLDFVAKSGRFFEFLLLNGQRQGLSQLVELTALALPLSRRKPEAYRVARFTVQALQAGKQLVVEGVVAFRAAGPPRCGNVLEGGAAAGTTYLVAACGDRLWMGGLAKHAAQQII